MTSENPCPQAASPAGTVTDSDAVCPGCWSGGSWALWETDPGNANAHPQEARFAARTLRNEQTLHEQSTDLPPPPRRPQAGVFLPVRGGEPAQATTPGDASDSLAVSLRMLPWKWAPSTLGRCSPGPPRAWTRTYTRVHTHRHTPSVRWPSLPRDTMDLTVSESHGRLKIHMACSRAHVQKRGEITPIHKHDNLRRNLLLSTRLSPPPYTHIQLRGKTRGGLSA